MSKYDEIRVQLIEELKKHEGQEVLDLKKFDKKFNEMFEMVMFNMLNNSDDKFYGTFLVNCNRVKCYGMEAPFAHQVFNTKINLLINPIAIVELDMETVKVYLKHEIIHLISKHYERIEELKMKYPEMLPLMASDLITNKILAKDVGKEKMHDKMLTVDKFNNMFDANLNIDEDISTEKLTEKLSQMCKSNEKLNKFVNDNNTFMIEKVQEELEKRIQKYKNGAEDTPNDQSLYPDADENMNMSGESGDSQAEMQQLANMLMSSIMKVKGDMMFIGDMLKNVVVETMGQTRGKYPAGLMSMIEKMIAPPVITWQQVLAMLLNSLPAGKKPTVFRRSRLHPERLDLKGKLPDKELDIVFAIDTSGSVSNKEIAEIASEIFAITKLIKTKITVVECDTAICKVYEANCPEEVQLDVRGRGGTSFTPVFQWLEENKTKDTVLIYASDGYGESKLQCKNISQSTVWLMTRAKDCLSCKQDVRPQDKVLSLTNK